MEGKALLFQRFAGIDSIDIEIDAESPQVLIDTVVRIADTFGGTNPDPNIVQAGPRT